MWDFDWPSTCYQPPTYRGHDVYIYDTAILRSNRLIGQEAKSVLYGGNIFVFFNLTNNSCAYLMISDILRNIAWNPVRIGAPVPSCVVQFNHGRQDGKPAGPSLIVAAADLKLICKNLIERGLCCHGPRTGYFLVALPQLGWQHERLLTMIWLPLKALREPRRTKDYFFINERIRVADCTGVFEQTVGMYKPYDFEVGNLSESNSDSDPIEDESNGSDSEDSESGDDNSCDKEDDGEEDSEEMDCTSNGSDVISEEVSNGDEASTSGESGEGVLDEAASVKSHEHYNKSPRAKPSPYTASTSSHDADANAQITIFDNNATQGCSGEDTGHQMHDDFESMADVDMIMDKKDAGAQ